MERHPLIQQFVVAKVPVLLQILVLAVHNTLDLNVNFQNVLVSLEDCPLFVLDMVLAMHQILVLALKVTLDPNVKS